MGNHAETEPEGMITAEPLVRGPKEQQPSPHLGSDWGFSKGQAGDLLDRGTDALYGAIEPGVPGSRGAAWRSITR